MTDASPPTMLADRAVIRVAGEDVHAFLQGLVTQDLDLVAPDRPQWGALLTPQGKAMFDFILWDDPAATGGGVLIDCEAQRAEALARRLGMYRLRRAITIEPMALAVHWSIAATRGVADPRLAALGNRWLAAPGPATLDWPAHRLSLGVTEGVGELGDGETLWLECNARELGGVSFTKGCYIGQENTARMHHRAKVNRRLVVAPLAERGERTRATYPELGVMVELRRVEALGDAMMPDWLRLALTSD